MRLLIRAYLALRDEATPNELASYLNEYFNWNSAITPSRVSSLLRDTYRTVLSDVYKRVNDSGAIVYYLSRNPTKEFKDSLKYIRETKHGFKIVKYVGGKNRYFGTYPSISEAIKYRDYCFEHDWNEDLRLQLLNKELVL